MEVTEFEVVEITLPAFIGLEYVRRAIHQRIIAWSI